MRRDMRYDAPLATAVNVVSSPWRQTSRRRPPHRRLCQRQQPPPRRRLPLHRDAPCTAIHSCASSPSGNCTAVRRFPDPCRQLHLARSTHKSLLRILLQLPLLGALGRLLGLERCVLACRLPPAPPAVPDASGGLGDRGIGGRTPGLVRLAVCQRRGTGERGRRTG